MLRPFGSRLTKSARLRVDRLEGRLVPAIFTVSSIADSGSGSLRQAIIDANANPGADTIQIPSSLTGTINLTSGPMTISDPVIINGPITIFSVTLVVSSNHSGRIFIVNANTTINGLGMDNGSATGSFSGFGGGVYSTAPLTLNDCEFGGDSSMNGGAIYQIGASLSVTRCGFYGDFATQGACVWSTGTVSVQFTEFDSDRTNNPNSGGGGIYLASGSLSLDSDTFRGCGSNNQSYGLGGAVYCNGTFFAQNCTFAQNGANLGGGLYLISGGTLWNCTVIYDVANGGEGGGIYGDVTLESTIVSNNIGGSGPDVYGAVTAKYCALGTSTGFSNFTDQGNNLAFGLNLQLPANKNTSGLVPAFAIQATSPCKNAGSNPGNLPYDTRGPGYPRVVGVAPDIGACEVQPPPTVVVHINGGAVQRSRVTQISYTFPKDIHLLNDPTWQLKRVSDNAIVTLTPSPSMSTATTVTYVSVFTGGPLNGNSLADGVYVLTVYSANMTDSAGQHLDGNGDGVGGDDYVSPTTQGDPNRIFRLFGDADGDASVGTSDFAIFRQSFNSVNDIFDFDGDGFVSVNDFIQFRNRFNTSI
jgi:hypothetical protein